ncbi:MAG: carbohydrate-binding protein [Porticoccaceae bacterium]|nr:carbohydrate-binding protein [Porticoccaceae bacterium]
MFAKKVLIALSLPFIYSLTACGGDSGGGDADQNVERDIFAVGDVLETKEDSPGVTGNVCENDLPDTCDLPDGDQNKISYALKKGEAMDNGSFSFCADGTYKYTPSGLFTGSESIQYTYSGEGAYGVGTLEINILEAGQVETGTVLDTNLHGDGSTFALAAGEAMDDGTLVFCDNGDIDYVPVQEFYGVDAINYVASLNGETSSALLTINVANDFETLDEYGWVEEWSDDFTDEDESNLGRWSGSYTVTAEGLTINPSDGQAPSLKSLQSIGEERGRVEAKIKTAAGIDVMSVFKLAAVNESYDGDNNLNVMLDKDGSMTAGAFYGLEKVSGVIMNDDIRSTASSDWRTYAIEWGEKKIRWYIDGTHIYTVDTLNLWTYDQVGNNPRGDQILANTTTLFDQRLPDPLGERKPGPFDQSMQIVFDLEAETNNLNSQMQIEYVKVWSCDSSHEPSIEECASREKAKISRAASDRIETVGYEQTTIFKDGYLDPATDAVISQFHPLSWHYLEDVFDLTISNNGNSKIRYPTLEDEHSLVVDFDNSSEQANLSVGTESAELNGYDISLNFDLFVDSAKTDIETIKIKMQSGSSGEDSADDLAVIEVSVALDEPDSWKSFSFDIPEDFTPSSENTSDFDPNNITSLMVLEVEGGAHLQLDNIYLGCINSEGCLQGPMAMQTPPAPVADPIRIEAEDNIVTQSGIGIYDVTAPDEGGGSYVGDVNDGDAVSYSFVAPAIGPYTIGYRVASLGGSAGFNVELDGSPLHSISLLDVNEGWEEWETLYSPEFELLDGRKTIEIKFIGDNQNLNWLEIQPPIGVFKLEAEDYDAMSGIDLETTTDTGGGQNIGWIDKDDWVEYTVFIPSTGDYLIEYRVAGEYDSLGFDVKLDGVLIDNQALNNPGGWQDWATQSRIVRGLTKGEKTMRLDFIDGPINTNWIQFTRLAPE